LQHELARQHRVRIGEPATSASGDPPGIAPASRPVPGEQGFPRPVARARLRRIRDREIGGPHDRDP
jgi:hypothetical protein